VISRKGAKTQRRNLKERLAFFLRAFAALREKSLLETDAYNQQKTIPHSDDR